jgi:hypothetical protein
MQKKQRLSSSFDTTKANAKGTEDRSPQHPSSTRLHRWSAAFRTSKVVCRRQNHCRWKNQTEATCPRTRDRTQELIIRIAGLHPQTQHRIHRVGLPTHIRVLLASSRWAKGKTFCFKDAVNMQIGDFSDPWTIHCTKTIRVNWIDTITIFNFEKTSPQLSILLYSVPISYYSNPRLFTIERLILDTLT